MNSPSPGHPLVGNSQGDNGNSSRGNNNRASNRANNKDNKTATNRENSQAKGNKQDKGNSRAGSKTANSLPAHNLRGIPRHRRVKRPVAGVEGKTKVAVCAIVRRNNPLRALDREVHSRVANPPLEAVPADPLPVAVFVNGRTVCGM